MANKRAEEAISQIKSRLREYLTDKGVNVDARYFRCVNQTAHRDDQPSCHFIPGTDETALFCFGCNRAFDIFSVAAILDKLPSHGHEFYNVTLTELAKRYGVEYTPTEFAPADRDLLDWFRAYSDAAQIVTSWRCTDDGHLGTPSEDDTIYQRIQERGWDLEKARAYGVGGVINKQWFIDQMKERGWSDSQLVHYYLNKGVLFHRGGLTFTIYDENGRPRGFVTRNARYVEGSKEEGRREKYINSRESTIYSKREILYGLNWSRKVISSNNNTLYVVEGYADFITLRLAGLENVCATGGTTFTKEHARLLHRLWPGFLNLILCFDGDDAGREAVDLALKELNDYIGIKVQILVMPDGKDPDDLIKESGIDAFKARPLFDSFRWGMERGLVQGKDRHDMAEDLLVAIAKDPKRVRRHQKLHQMSSYLNIPYKDLEAQLDRMENELDYERRDKEKAIVDRAVKEYGYGTTALTAMRDAVIQLEAVDDAYSNNKDVFGEYSARLTGIRKDIQEGVFDGLRFAGPLNGWDGPTPFGNELQSFERTIDGIPRMATLGVIAGDPQAGKSSFSRLVAYYTARYNANAVVFFLSLDDPLAKAAPSLVATLAGIPYWFVTNPEFAAKFVRGAPKEKRAELAERIIHRREKAWKEVFNLANEHRLLFQDASRGRSLDHLESVVRTLRREYPGKVPVVFLDSFDKMSRMSLSSGARTDIDVRLIGHLDALRKRMDFPLIMTKEMKKEQFRGLRDMTGTYAVAYDAELCIFLDNTLNDDRESIVKWELPKHTTDGEMARAVNAEVDHMPFVKLSSNKSKLGAWKGEKYYKFYSYCGRFEEVSWTDVPREDFGSGRRKY